MCAAVVSSQTFKGHGGSSKAKMASSIKKCLQMPCDGKTMLDTQKYTFVFCFFSNLAFFFLEKHFALKKIFLPKSLWFFQKHKTRLGFGEAIFKVITSYKELAIQANNYITHLN